MMTLERTKKKHYLFLLKQKNIFSLLSSITTLTCLLNQNNKIGDIVFIIKQRAFFKRFFLSFQLLLHIKV